MRSAISIHEDDQYDFINGLIKLFHDIDINGDREMQWNEFTQYIIDAVIGRNENSASEGFLTVMIF